MKKKIFKERKSITYLLKISKVLVFLSLIYTIFIMFKLKNFNTTILIIFAASFFLLFNKVESIDRRIKILEEK